MMASVNPSALDMAAVSSGFNPASPIAREVVVPMLAIFSF